MALLRTMLFVPGGRPEMLAKAATFSADAIIFDLEDSVPPADKERARDLVRAAIPSVAGAGKQAWVRVNGTYTGLTKDDCRAVMSPELTGIVIPKADSADIVRFAEALVRDAEALNGVEPGKTRLIACIENAAALLRAEAISRASARLVALTLGGEDYTADMQVERTPGGAELTFARSMVAVVAHAAGLTALDTVYPYLHDLDGLVREAAEGKRAGYQGKFLIHPEQVAPVSTVFTPSSDELHSARRIVAAYQEGSELGHGAIQVDGIMVDAPVAKRAQQLLDLFETANQI
jgi:citrate lyase subunit beta/citryl-CoA lyase